MKVLNKLTISSLKLNKKRTLVTMIGIILATALITVVAGTITSGQSTLKEYSKTMYGDYHVAFLDVPVEDLSKIEQNRNLEKYFLTSNIGYANLEGSQNPDKPYAYVMAYDSLALSQMPINIVEGRLPQNNNEIIISKSIKDNGELELKVGETISLDIAKRLLDGKELKQSDVYTEEEHLEKMYEKEYKIVGIMERLNTDIEPYIAPGYSMITYLDSNNLQSKANIYVTFNKDSLKNYKNITCQILDLDEKEQEEKGYSGLDRYSIDEEPTRKYDISLNTSLLNFEGVGLNNTYMRMLYLVGAVVISIIIISSVFVIRNSFAISITERTRQYGMLSSIGATKKQIRKNVLFEGLILGIIAIPLGILLGIMVNGILALILNVLIKNIYEEINFIYSVPVMAIIASIILSCVTIYLSCLSSARKASKVSPIDAIRSSEDIKIKNKKIKSPKIIKKLFGIGGVIAYKNLKRNKKKYRTTVVSLVVSIMIFISVTSLVEYGFTLSNSTYKELQYNMNFYANSREETRKEQYNKLLEITKLDTVKEYSIQKVVSLQFDLSSLKIKTEAKDYVENKLKGYYYQDDENKLVISMYALGKQEYERYIKDLGLEYEDAKDKLIIIDDFTNYIYENGESGSYKKQIGQLYDYKYGETIEGTVVSEKNKEKETFKVATTTTKRPMGLETYSSTGGIIVVSDEFIDKYDWYLGTLFVNSTNPGKLEQEVLKNYSNVQVSNLENEVKAQNSLILIIAIFLYGFIIVITLIGVTNIFNTITSNMNLRSKEFANLKSIGMTKREFNRMIRLESIFYGTKSIIIGIPLGVLGSYLLYLAFNEGIQISYMFPIMPTIIAVILVFLLIGGIMRYSLNKINKQNIIETIRKDNI